MTQGRLDARRTGGSNSIKGSEFPGDIVQFFILHSLLFLYLRSPLKGSFDYVSYPKSSKGNNPIALYYYITPIDYHNRDLLLEGRQFSTSELGAIHTKLLRKLKIVL
jgi:hypothetical protein